MKSKYKLKDFTTVIFIVVVLSLYLIYIKPVGLYDIINSGSIRSASAHVIFNDLQEHELNEVPNYYNITLEKEDFDEYIEILNKYKYSKIPIYYFGKLRPTKFSSKIIDCTINYDDDILHQQVSVYYDNEVSFYNKKGVYRNYTVHGDGLFEELLAWLNERYITNINNPLSFSFDDNGNYTGFSDFPLNYTIEDAMSDGYYGIQGLEVVANKNVWDSFVEASLNKRNTSMRIVSFHTDTIYFKDLFYRDGYYYCFDSSAEKQEKMPYQYLLTLEGQFGNPLNDSAVVIMTDDNTLTFDKIIQAALSSDINYIKSISPYKLIMFK